MTSKRGNARYRLWLADNQRIARQYARDRETLGARALSAQITEFACGADARELAELFALRLVAPVMYARAGELPKDPFAAFDRISD